MRHLLGGIIVIISIWCAGCAAKGKDIPLPEHTWTRTVEGTCACSRDMAWNATITSLSGYTLEREDISSGLAVSNWKTAIVPHDVLGPAAVIVGEKTTASAPEVFRTPPRVLNINFEVKRRLTVNIADGEGGRTRITVTRQMIISYFDGPKGSMNPEVYERLREDFDTEEELEKILKNILEKVSEN